MKHSDYPCLFQKSDTASLLQQKYYLISVKTEFICIGLASIAGGIFIASPQKCGVVIAIAILISVLIAFIIRVCQLIVKWDDKWFDTRAVAESAKTATWRYIMGAEPFSYKLSKEDVDKKFVNEMDEIFKTRPDAHSVMASCDAQGDQQISDRMREIRAMELAQRRDLYISQRVKDQRDWYKKKAKYNESQGSRWFFATMTCEFIAILFSIFMIFNPSSIFNPMGAITTLAAIFCAWAQIKKYRELSQSYSLACQELTSVESLGQHVADQEKLAEYVLNGENAISREHTMWCAKRT